MWKMAILLVMLWIGFSIHDKPKATTEQPVVVQVWVDSPPPQVVVNQTWEYVPPPATETRVAEQYSVPAAEVVTVSSPSPEKHVPSPSCEERRKVHEETVKKWNALFD